MTGSRMMKLAAFAALLLFAPSVFAKRIDFPKEASVQDIGRILNQTVGVTISCGDDVDMRTCKLFMNALSYDLRARNVSVYLYYDPEVLVQSFYVPPRLEEVSINVTLRLIEDGAPGKTTLYLGGTCFEGNLAPFQLPRWSQPEAGRDTGPTEYGRRGAASRIAREISDYWLSVAASQEQEKF